VDRLALITAILQLNQSFRPIDIVAVFLLLGMGLAGWVWNYAVRIPDPPAGNASLVNSSASPSFQLSTWNIQLLNFLLLFIAAAIIAFRCAVLGEHYDTGLYGVQAVRWFITYPLVPGRSNLIAQFGFNSSVFLCIAALDQGPWRDLAHHLFDGFLCAALFASMIPAGLRILRAESNSASDWFFTLLFLPAAIWATTSKIVGTNTDLPTSVVCIVAAAMLLGRKTHCRRFRAIRERITQTLWRSQWSARKNFSASSGRNRARREIIFRSAQVS
jgi:hypothetical protein